MWFYHRTRRLYQRYKASVLPVQRLCTGSTKHLYPQCKPSRGRNYMPRIRDRAFFSLKNMPQIWGAPMHKGQKHASDPGHTYAQGAETWLRFRAYLCTGGRNMPQIQDAFMHREQKRASNLGQNYARGVETCPRFQA